MTAGRAVPNAGMACAASTRAAAAEALIMAAARAAIDCGRAAMGDGDRDRSKTGRVGLEDRTDDDHGMVMCVGGVRCPHEGLCRRCLRWRGDGCLWCAVTCPMGWSSPPPSCGGGPMKLIVYFMKRRSAGTCNTSTKIPTQRRNERT
jgi:hypothetical protein